MPKKSHLFKVAGHPVIGLDVGTHRAKAVLCRPQASGWDVLAVDSLRLDPGDSGDPESLAARMVPWLKQLGDQTTSGCIASLPSNFVDYETIERSETESEEETAILAMEELLGSDLQDAAYDFWTNQEDASQRIHLTWTMANFATSITDHFSRCGLSCGRLDAPVTALARVKTGSSVERSRLVIDVGQGEATFVYSRGNEACYYRNRIRFVPQSAAETVAYRQSISLSSAETLLATYGIATVPANPLAELMTRLLDDWLQNLTFEIQRTCQFIYSRWGKSAVDQIVLCGGGACLPGLSPWLSAQFDLPVESAGIPPGWRWLASQPYSPAFAQAIALAT